MNLTNIIIGYYTIATPIFFIMLFGIRQMSEDRGVRPTEPELVTNLKKAGM